MRVKNEIFRNFPYVFCGHLITSPFHIPTVFPRWYDPFKGHDLNFENLGGSTLIRKYMAGSEGANCDYDLHRHTDNKCISIRMFSSKRVRLNDFSLWGNFAENKKDFLGRISIWHNFWLHAWIFLIPSPDCYSFKYFFHLHQYWPNWLQYDSI